MPFLSAGRHHYRSFVNITSCKILPPKINVRSCGIPENLNCYMPVAQKFLPSHFALVKTMQTQSQFAQHVYNSFFNIVNVLYVATPKELNISVSSAA